ncbi:catecholate siderophore receptor Fiu [Methylibium sp.]|uniref:catecholate siderophore receptor Fiu n=1 Tax=Methylibium sp. TaxID=2067992 RepID=UPI003D110FD3
MAYIQARKHAHPLRRTQSAAAAFAALAIPAAVHAQQAAAPAEAAAAPASTQVLPEIKAKSAADNGIKADVSASPKFTQPLVDTPQTITVIKKEVLQQQGATSLTEALRNTPGITLQMGENGNTQTGDAIFLRGFDTSASIFVDGIRDLGSISRDTFNIEQVEVIKGPSGSDNGRGASSGYVNLISKSPQLQNFGNASVSLGTDDRKRATVDLNRALDLAVPGSALRLNVMAQDYGTPGRDEVKSKRWGFAPSLAFGLGTPTRTVLSYLHVEHDNRPDGGVSTFGLPGYISAATGPAVNSKNYYGSLNDFDEVSVDQFTARIEHDIAPGYTLRNTTRLGRSEQDLLVTGVNAVTTTSGNPATYTVARTRQGKHQNNEILTNQTNLNAEFATGAVQHSLSTGFELIYERQRTATPQTLTNTTLPASLRQPQANLYAPSVGDVFLTPPYKGAYANGSTLSAAVYAFDTLKLSEQWLLNGGVRWEKFHTETNSSTFTAQTNTSPESLVQNPQLGLTDTLLSWKVGAVFKPAPNGSVYVTVSNSYQPPGGSNFSLASTANSANRPDLDPQEGSNIEVGSKWDLLDGRLSAVAAVYRSENKNELVSDGATPASFSQVGKRRVDGAELGLIGQITPALSLSAGLAYMDPQIIQGVPAGTGANQGGVIVFSPKLTFTSWVTYKLPFGLTVGGGARYVDTVARSSNLVVTSNLVTTPDYWVADAMLAYDVTKNFSLQLNVYNLFDKEYIAALNNGGSRYVPGAERNALLTANFSF